MLVGDEHLGGGVAGLVGGTLLAEELLEAEVVAVYQVLLLLL